MRFQGVAYRAHNPMWSFRPLSGDGAALRGGRFNPSGAPALYLSLSLNGAIREANQGLPFKIDPCLLCSYEVDCEDIVDLSHPVAQSAAGVGTAELSCAWLLLSAAGAEPPSWALSRRLIAAGSAGILAPSFAPGATAGDVNLVLWDWTDSLPHRVTVHDPSGRLPKDQLSWR